MKRLHVISIFTASLIAASLAACSDAGSSDGTGGENSPRTLTLSNWTAPSSASVLGLEEWADLVEEGSDGELKIEIVHGGALLPPADTLQGVADGRADLGHATYAYTPDRLPLSQILGMPGTAANPEGDMRAVAALYAESDDFRQEWENNGVRVLYHWANPESELGCKEPVTALEDLKGRTVRSVGLTATIFQSVGANVVGITAPEIREAMERGVIDCWSALPLDIVVGLGLHEVTPYVYDYGHLSAGGTELVISTGVWDSLSESQQAAIDAATEAIILRANELTEEVGAQSCEAVLAAGVETDVLSDAAIRSWRSAAADAVRDAYADLAAASGADVDAFIDTFLDLIAENEAEASAFTGGVAAC